MADFFGRLCLIPKQNPNKKQKILVFLCDAGQKYVSKIFNDDWMRENGFVEDQPGLGVVRQGQARRPSPSTIRRATASTLSSFAAESVDWVHPAAKATA